MERESLLERIVARILTPTRRAEDLYAEALQALEGTETGWQDADRAFRLFKHAAHRRHLQAMVKLGECHEHGVGVDVDQAEAVRCYRQAAEGKSAEGISRLGDCYRKGVGVTKNFKEAILLYQTAVEKNDPTGQNGLGICHEDGLGVAKNPQKAVQWYQQGAEQGCAEAQCNLGRCYSQGFGVAVDHVQATRWFSLASGQGKEAIDHLLRKQTRPAIAEAMFQLGACYEGGLGVEKDVICAERWYGEAAHRQHPEACRKYATLRKGDGSDNEDCGDSQDWTQRAKQFARP